jgi:flagellar protein FlaG
LANVSISELVLFIAALTVAAGVATTLTANVMDISNAVSERGGGVADKIETEVEVINDPGSPSSIYDNGTVSVLVKNTGERTLDASPSGIDVLVDGSYATIDKVTVVSGGTEWQSGEVVRVNVTRTLSSDDHRVVVYVGEDEEVLRFRT